MYVKYLNVSSHFVYWAFCNGKMIMHSHEKTLSWCPSLRDWVQRCGYTGAVRGHRKVSQFLLTAGPFGNDLTFCLWSCFSWLSLYLEFSLLFSTVMLKEAFLIPSMFPSFFHSDIPSATFFLSIQLFFSLPPFSISLLFDLLGYCSFCIFSVPEKGLLVTSASFWHNPTHSLTYHVSRKEMMICFSIKPRSLFYAMRCSSTQNPSCLGKRWSFFISLCLSIQMYNVLHWGKTFPLTSSKQSLCALKHEIQLPISLSWLT